jgi:hypothetical protein
MTKYYVNHLTDTIEEVEEVEEVEERRSIEFPCGYYTRREALEALRDRLIKDQELYLALTDKKIAAVCEELKRATSKKYYFCRLTKSAVEISGEESKGIKLFATKKEALHGELDSLDQELESFTHHNRNSYIEVLSISLKEGG